jgi:hypothetical protein
MVTFMFLYIPIKSDIQKDDYQKPSLDVQGSSLALALDAASKGPVRNARCPAALIMRRS